MTAQKDKYLTFLTFIANCKQCEEVIKRQVLCQHLHALLLEG